jgi:hypothetical protein
MIDKIKALFIRNSRQRRRRFLISVDALEAYGDLSKSSQALLRDILRRIKSDEDIYALIVTGMYDEFGYKHRTGFYRDRKRLREAGFLIYQHDHHFVNPCMLEYHNKKQRLHIMREINTKSSLSSPNFGKYSK